MERPGFEWLESQMLQEFTSEEFQIKVQTLKEATVESRRALSRQKRAESFLRALPPGLPPLAPPAQLSPMQEQPEVFDVSVATVEPEHQRRVVARL